MFDYLDFNQTNWLDALAAEYRRKGIIVQYQPFVYPADFLPLKGSATATQNVVIDNDSDFILCKQMASVFDDSGNPVFNANILYTLVAGTSQRTYQSAALPLTNVFGTGQRPHLLFKPLHFPAKSSYAVELANQTSGDLSVRLSYEGVKAYLTGSRG